MAETMTGTPLRVRRPATNPILSTFVSLSSRENPNPLERFVLTMSPSKTSTLPMRSRSSCSTISAMVVLPAPESPVNHNVNPRSFCSMRFLQTVRPLLELVVYIPGDGLSGPGADGQALFFLKAFHHLSSVLRRGGRQG